MKINKLYVSISLLFMFLFMFLDVNNINASNINNNNEVFKNIKKVNSMRNITPVYKEYKIKSIMDNAAKNDLIIYEKWKNNQFDRSIKLLNEKIENNGPVNVSKTYSSTLDDGTVINVSVEDVAVNEDESPKIATQTNIWKKYGNRRYTYTVTVLTTSIKLISGYTVGTKGLTTRYVDTNFSSILVGVDLINAKWAKKTAVKVGDKINSSAKWKISVPIISASKTQKAFMKIVKWDKKNKKMLIAQTGQWT